MAGGGGIHGRQRLSLVLWTIAFPPLFLSLVPSFPRHPLCPQTPSVVPVDRAFLPGRSSVSPSKPSLLPHPPAGPGYAPLREEAVRLFLALQALEGARRPGPLMQGVLQTCRDLPALQDELFLQLAKQTSGPAGPPGLPATQDPATLRYWQLLTCMSCTFRPGGAVRGHLLGHLER